MSRTSHIFHLTTLLLMAVMLASGMHMCALAEIYAAPVGESAKTAEGSSIEGASSPRALLLTCAGIDATAGPRAIAVPHPLAGTAAPAGHDAPHLAEMAEAKAIQNVRAPDLLFMLRTVVLLI